MKIFTISDITNTMRGATLLASGGGGSLNDGMIMLTSFSTAHPDVPIEISVCRPEEMDDRENAVVVAVMGAPSGGANQDITPCVLSAYDEVKKLAASQGANIKYTLPIEMGGFNTFVPMLISLSNHTPIIDADASGRAVPTLDTLLSHVNGCRTSPVALANVKDDRVTIQTKDAHDAARVQSLAVPVVAIFEQNAGIAGWMLNRAEIQSAIPNGTLTMASRIGEFLVNSLGSADDAFTLINKHGICKAVSLAREASIYNFQTGFKDGWDVGDYYVGYDPAERTGMYHVKFSNESLLLYQVQPNGQEKIVMTAPDIITFYDCRSHIPLTNEDLQVFKEEGRLDSLKITLGVIQVHDKWWLNPQKTSAVWKKYFSLLGYDGDVVRYSF